MRSAIEIAAGRSDLVLLSGGLGPTMDDLTVDVVAAIAGEEPVIHESSAARMRERFTELGVPLVANATRQVRVVAGARVYDNPAGLAPGFEIALGQAQIICLPGPPPELQAIFSTHLEQRIVALRDARGNRVSETQPNANLASCP